MSTEQFAMVVVVPETEKENVPLFPPIIAFDLDTFGEDSDSINRFQWSPLSDSKQHEERKDEQVINTATSENFENSQFESKERFIIIAEDSTSIYGFIEHWSDTEGTQLDTTDSNVRDIDNDSFETELSKLPTWKDSDNEFIVETMDSDLYSGDHLDVHEEVVVTTSTSTNNTDDGDGDQLATTDSTDSRVEVDTDLAADVDGSTDDVDYLDLDLDRTPGFESLIDSVINLRDSQLLRCMPWSEDEMFNLMDLE